LAAESEAFAMCRRVARDEGVLVGISSGAAAHVALSIVREAGGRQTVVCILADTGQRYLSVDGLFQID
jgi:cysteine synthase A